MANFARVACLLPLVGSLLLSACGGGGGGGASPVGQQSGQSIAVGEPNPSTPLVTTAFVARAQQASCAERTNRLYVIDQKYVFWDVAGLCADASYAYNLYGSNPDTPLCSQGDSIMGPRSSCTDEKLKPLFDTIVAGRAKADLGLGADHKVEALTFLPKDGTVLTYDILSKQAFSGIHTRRYVVVKDAAALATLWAEHGANQIPAPPVPLVDFKSKMVVGVFLGDSGCHEFGIRNVTMNGAKIRVEFEDRDISAIALCVAVVPQPMQLITIERSDAAVEFAEVALGRVDFRTIENTTRSLIDVAQNRVARNAQVFAAMWRDHRGSDLPVPEVDFSKDMVIGVFAGARPAGCYSLQIDAIALSGDRLNVYATEHTPGPADMCTANIVYPMHMVTVPRNDAKVEFILAKQART